MSEGKLEVKVLVWTHKNPGSLFSEMFRELLKSVPAVLTCFNNDGGRFGHVAIEIPLPSKTAAHTKTPMKTRYPEYLKSEVIGTAPTPEKKLYISLFKRGLDEFRSRISDHEQFGSNYALNVYKIYLSKQDIEEMLNKFKSITGDYTELYQYSYIGRHGNKDKDAERKIIAYPINTTRRSIFQSCTAEGFPHSGENCTSLVAHLLNETNFGLNYRPNTCALLTGSFIAGAAAAWTTGDFARALKSHTDHKELPLSLAAVVLFTTQGGWVILSSLSRCCSIDQSYEDRMYICLVLIEVGLALADLIVEAKSGAMNDLTNAAASDSENFWGYGFGIGAAAFVTYFSFIACQLALYASYRPSLLNKVLEEHVTQNNAQVNQQPTEEYYREWLQKPNFQDQPSGNSVFELGSADDYRTLSSI